MTTRELLDRRSALIAGLVFPDYPASPAVTANNTRLLREIERCDTRINRPTKAGGK